MTKYENIKNFRFDRTSRNRLSFLFSFHGTLITMIIVCKHVWYQYFGVSVFQLSKWVYRNHSLSPFSGFVLFSFHFSSYFLFIFYRVKAFAAFPSCHPFPPSSIIIVFPRLHDSLHSVQRDSLFQCIFFMSNNIVSCRGIDIKASRRIPINLNKSGKWDKL